MSEKELKYALYYLLAGIGTMAYTVSLGAEGRPHFKGVEPGTYPTVGALEAVLLWPYALIVNLRGG